MYSLEIPLFILLRRPSNGDFSKLTPEILRHLFSEANRQTGFTTSRQTAFAAALPYLERCLVKTCSETQESDGCFQRMLMQVLNIGLEDSSSSELTRLARLFNRSGCIFCSDDNANHPEDLIGDWIYKHLVMHQVLAWCHTHLVEWARRGSRLKWIHRAWALEDHLRILNRAWSEVSHWNSVVDYWGSTFTWDCNADEAENLQLDSDSDVEDIDIVNYRAGAPGITNLLCERRSDGFLYFENLGAQDSTVHAMNNAVGFRWQCPQDLRDSCIDYLESKRKRGLWACPWHHCSLGGWYSPHVVAVAFRRAGVYPMQQWQQTLERRPGKIYSVFGALLDAGHGLWVAIRPEGRNLWLFDSSKAAPNLLTAEAFETLLGSSVAILVIPRP